MTKSKLLILGLVIFMVGCAGRQYKLQPDARSQYEYALAKYQAGDYDESVLEFQKVLFNYPGLNFIDSAQYWFAMSYYNREDHYLGIAEFRRLINQFSSSELADDAQFMIGKSYFEVAPGNTGLDQSDTELAIRELRAFLEDYPRSDRREDGQGLLDQAIDKIVRKQFNAAKLYYKMGNRISSRLYFEDIVTEHADSKYAPEALYMLARIDVKEDKYSDARTKLRNLLATFPDAAIVEDARELSRDIEAKADQEESEQESKAENANHSG